MIINQLYVLPGIVKGVVMDNLRITTVQAELFWENPQRNRDQFASCLDHLINKTDLVVLPEMFTTGFTMNSADYAEPPEDVTHQWLKRWSAKINAAIIGSYIIIQDGLYFNCATCVFPDGTTYRYNKRHLFRMGQEEKFFTAGNKLVEFNIKGWKIRSLICYDLRFPVWSRNNTDYDVLIYMANWPENRSSIWSTLLSARAIENQSYVVGVNRIGIDGNNLEYNGFTSVYDFQGDILYEQKDIPEVVTTVLSRDSLSMFKKGFPAHLDRDDFKLNI